MVVEMWPQQWCGWAVGNQGKQCLFVEKAVSCASFCRLFPALSAGSVEIRWFRWNLISLILLNVDLRWDDELSDFCIVSSPSQPLLSRYRKLSPQFWVGSTLSLGDRKKHKHKNQKGSCFPNWKLLWFVVPVELLHTDYPKAIHSCHRLQYILLIVATDFLVTVWLVLTDHCSLTILRTLLTNHDKIGITNNYITIINHYQAWLIHQPY